MARSDKRVDEREGWYTCVLYKHSQTSTFTRDLDHEPNSPIGPVHGKWELANAGCSFYASDDERESQTRAFDVAMADLSRQR